MERLASLGQGLADAQRPGRAFRETVAGLTPSQGVRSPRAALQRPSSTQAWAVL